MKRRLNVRALVANLFIMMVLAGMMASSLQAKGVAPHTGSVLLFFACLTPLIVAFALTNIKVRMTNRRTGEVKETVLSKPYVTLWLLGRLMQPFTAGINKEVWEEHIMENLFPNNSFLEDMMDESEYVNYLTVHSPNAGSVPDVLVDPVFPLNGGAGLNVSQRQDFVVNWDIHVFFCGPFLINNAEQVQLSYNKRESVLYNMEMAIRRVIAENILIYCAPTGTGLMPDGVTTNVNLIRTTGITNNDPNNIVSSPSYLPGTTGNRLNYTLFDFAEMKTYFDLLDVPEEDRCCVMSPKAERQIVSDMLATKYRGTLDDVYDLNTGTIQKLMGFKIHHRSKVMSYTNAGVVKAYKAAAAATDCDAMVFWQKGALAKAVGDIIMYEQLGSPRDGGDIYSILIRCGASKKRLSEVGVAVLVQAVAA